MKVVAVALMAGVAIICSLEEALPGSTGAGAATIAGQDAETSIRATLNAQVEAWNAGDIPGFMKGYVQSEKLRFASGNTVQRGWDKTLERYQKAYPTRDAMGQLKFSDLEVRVLSEEFAEVFGRFHLTRDPAIGDAEGLFTLLVQKQGEQWLVLHDHTSAAASK